MLVVRSPNEPASERNPGTFNLVSQLLWLPVRKLVCSVSFPQMTEVLPYCYWFNKLSSPLLCCFLHPPVPSADDPAPSQHIHTAQSVFSITEGVEISTGVVKSAADRREMALAGADPPATCSYCSSSTQNFPSLYLC